MGGLQNATREQRTEGPTDQFLSLVTNLAISDNTKLVNINIKKARFSLPTRNGKMKSLLREQKPHSLANYMHQLGFGRTS